ncbi:DUF6599 family protein [Silvibacterium sp.]|uniref:DUF6599 family protein n=1 Tax=Silvibacterium sp. TaxID=1964179 RepID=UPI0039E46F52
MSTQYSDCYGRTKAERDHREPELKAIRATRSGSLSVVKVSGVAVSARLALGSVVWLCGACAPMMAQSAPSSAAPVMVTLPHVPIALPATLAGWTLEGSPQTGSDPAQADAAKAAPLREYGLRQYVAGSYRHGGATLAVKVMGFPDATGAYGAFTLYRAAGMHPADFNLERGREGAVGDGMAVFWTGTECVTATSSHVGAAERDALTTLAAGLPKNIGPDGVPPPLPRYLPAEGPGGSLERNTVRYAVGPEGYAQGGGVLPAGVVDFSRDAEVVTGRYGRETLTIVEYPTPQMAIASQKALEGLLKGGGAPGGLQNAVVKQTGPLMAVASGSEKPADAQKLLVRVKYDAEVTVDRTGEAMKGTTEVKKTARLLVGIVSLTLILGAAALLLGLFLGGGRALYRVMRGKPVSTLNDEEFITLHLE